MQQRPLEQAGLGAEIETDLLLKIFRLQERAPLPLRKVAGEWILRDPFADLTYALSHVELSFDECQPHRMAVAKGGQGGLAHFWQAGHRHAAQCSQSEGEPGGSDGRGAVGAG
jgi:hypothetical protein